MGSYSKKVTIEYTKSRKKIKRVEDITKNERNRVQHSTSTLEEDFDRIIDAPDWLKQQGCKKAIPLTHGFGFCMKPNGEFKYIDFENKKIEDWKTFTKDDAINELEQLAIPESEWLDIDKKNIKTKVSEDFWDQFK